MKNLNKKFGNKILLIGLAALLAVSSGTALAQQPGYGRGGGQRGYFGGPDNGRFGAGVRGMGPEMRLEMLAERLDLTDEQSTAISAIREEQRAENLELRKELMRLRNARQGQMLKDGPAKGEVLGLTDQMNKVRGEMRLNAMETRLAVREVLTQEQRDKMLMMRMDGRQGRRGPGQRGAGQFDPQGPGNRGFGRYYDCPLGNW